MNFVDNRELRHKTPRHCYKLHTLAVDKARSWNLRLG